jgi:hypothetical protein
MLVLKHRRGRSNLKYAFASFKGMQKEEDPL